ncbi:hypothetical protein C0Q70_19433 [Pomacea canaliculata]|uniref:Sulfotransferase domain-containing protein n=1 Tax=Pomacea canaliculata TaxID=400727 RepID=A0A2T7NJB2_POMCA|nr:hypothetical protein C0Q70_19433 [Pomacea canaliculata]
MRGQLSENKIITRNRKLKTETGVTSGCGDGERGRREVHPAAAPSVKRILLVTYGRSGSTFTSYVLKEAQEAFLFFEPLRPLVMRKTQGMDIIMSYQAVGAQFYEPQELNSSMLSEYERSAVGVLDSILDCNMTSLTIDDYLSPVIRHHEHTKDVSRCLRSILNDSYLNLPHYLQCLIDFWNLCRSRTLRLIKTIRMPLRALFELMRKYPDLYLVYLVRDPRATLMSQRQNFGHSPMPQNFCNLVQDDVAHMRLLQQLFPSRAIAVRYEDIIVDPLEWSKRLYAALGLTMTPRVVSLIRLYTRASGDGSAYQVYRKDPKNTANRWRSTIAYSAVRLIDYFCAEAYRALGYVQVHNETLLRNTNESLTCSTNTLEMLQLPVAA